MAFSKLDKTIQLNEGIRAPQKSEVLEYLLTIGAAVVSRLSLLLVTLINTQMMPSEEFGVFTILMLIANMVGAFVSCGGDLWLNRFSRPRHAILKRAPIISRLYFYTSLFLASLVLVVALYFAFPGQNLLEYRGTTIAWCLLWATCIGLMETILAIQRTTNVIQRFFVIRDFLMPVTLIAAIFVIQTDTAEKFFKTASMIWLIALAFSLKFLFQKAERYIPPLKFRWKMFKKTLVAHTTSLIVNNFTARLANGQDTLILAEVSPISLVGKYRFVSHFANAFNVIQHFVFLAFPWQMRSHANLATSPVSISKTPTSCVYAEGAQVVKTRQALLLGSAIVPLIILVLLAKPLLKMLGSGFEPMAFALAFFLLIRFSELLWGPQHEFLVSNKKVNWDTLANVIAMGIGVGVFFTAFNFYDAINSGLLAAGCSSITGQLTRYILLKKQSIQVKLEKVSFGPYYPILLVVVSMIYVLFK